MISMEKKPISDITERTFVISLNKEEINIYIIIKLRLRKILNLIIQNVWILFVSLIKIIFLPLIIIVLYYKYEYFSDIYFGMKIFYKNEKDFDLVGIRKEIRNYKNLVISFNNQEDLTKRKNPKISIIVTIYNQEHFLRYCYAYIKKQEMKDIEIIFIDDASKDNSSKIIYNLMEKDKRIIYLKNKFNKRAFYSRNRGVLFSKGEYILIVDPDDLLLNNILIKAFETTKYYNLDILQFYVLRGSYLKNKIWFKNKYKSGILYHEKVKDVFFYSVSRTLWDKLIKREVFVKGIEFMKEDYHKTKYFLHNDDTIFWGIICSANSYGFLEQIGYFYNIDNPDSTVHHYFDSKYMNDIFYSLFTTMKYYYIQTEDNYNEKNYVGYKFFNEKIYKYYQYQNTTDNLTRGFDYIIEVLNMYINCTFFNATQKYNLNHFKNLIINELKEKCKVK